jgi:calmodulin
MTSRKGGNSTSLFPVFDQQQQQAKNNKTAAAGTFNESSPFLHNNSNSGDNESFNNSKTTGLLSTTTTFTTAITESERKEFREMFNFCKREGNTKETRDRAELKVMMDTLRLNPTEAELDAMMLEVDTDHSGDVDFDEFVDVMSRTKPFPLPSAKLRQSFKFFEDEVKEGFCSTELLRDAILYHCKDEIQNPSDSEYAFDEWDEASYLLSKLDPARTGMIKIDDLMSVIEQSEKAVADLQREMMSMQKQRK